MNDATHTKRHAALTLMAIGLCLGLLGLTGCSTGMPGVKNEMGNIRTTLEANPRQLTEVAERTLADMGLSIISSQSTAVDGQIVARTAQDRRVTLHISEESDDLSKLTIRVGTFGDEAVSLALLKRIERRLNQPDAGAAEAGAASDAQDG